jgi:hypothetical protein
MHMLWSDSLELHMIGWGDSRPWALAITWPSLSLPPQK